MRPLTVVALTFELYTRNVADFQKNGDSCCYQATAQVIQNGQITSGYGVFFPTPIRELSAVSGVRDGFRTRQVRPGAFLTRGCERHRLQTRSQRVAQITVAL